jgi:hypothetical protein
MAKKRSPKKMEAVAEPRLMPVRVDLEPEHHDRLRLVAAKKRMSMARFAKTILVETVRRMAKEEGLE